MHSWQKITVLLPALALATSAPAAANITRVPSESPTIAHAISVSDWGDTVYVAPGTYSGSGSYELSFGGKDIQLLSEGGPEVTILDGGHAHRVFEATSAEPLSARVRGFTFRNGQTEEPWGTVGMVNIYSYSKMTFENMIFEGGYAEGAGGAVHVHLSSQAIFNNCVFRNNIAGHKGAGAYVEESAATFNDCLFEGNAALEGAALLIQRGSATFNDCVVQDNVGGGVFAYWYSSVMANRSTFRNNTGGAGVVINLQNNAGATMTDCLVTGNTATSSWEGGIILAELGSFHLTRCTIADNTCGAAASGAVDDRHDGSTITNCIITGTKVGMGTKRCETITCSLFFGNEGGDVSPCIDLSADGNLNVAPQFCDPANEDYQLAVDSPCLPKNSGACDQIGAMGAGGCVVTSVEPMSFGRVKAMYR